MSRRPLAKYQARTLENLIEQARLSLKESAKVIDHEGRKQAGRDHATRLLNDALVKLTSLELQIAAITEEQA